MRYTYRHSLIYTTSDSRSMSLVRDRGAIRVLRKGHSVKDRNSFDRLPLLDRNFEHFTIRARKAIMLAEEEARSLQHAQIGSEHLLLGLLRSKEGVTSLVLNKLGVELPVALKVVEELVGRSTEPLQEDLTFSRQAYRALDCARDEARRLHHTSVGTEHILLGLMGEKDGIVAHVLLRLGVTAQQVRRETLYILGHPDKEAWVARRAAMSVSTRSYQLVNKPVMQVQQIMRYPLTQQSYQVLVYSQEEALHLQHHAVDTEHLLLGLLRESDSVAATVLRNLGVELETVRTAVEFIVGRGERVVFGFVDFTPLVKKILVAAAKEAQGRREVSPLKAIDTEDILLALARGGEGMAFGILNSLDVSSRLVQERILTAIGSHAH
jgi:ATP-dependent Clp protease ATP-binding subunit ClpA